MIKKENTRIIITMSKEKADLLRFTSKRANVSVSYLVNMAIDSFLYNAVAHNRKITKKGLK